MKRKKKDLPLIVLKTLEPFLTKGSKFYRIVDPGESLLKIVDNDPTSDFYFEIKNYSTGNGFRLEIESKPKSRSDVKPMSTTIEGKSLDSYFKSWTTFLEEYENINIFDDPILRQYQEEFEQEIKIVDEDADYTTYDYQTQIWLDEYLTKYQALLKEFKTEENKTEVESIDIDIEELKTEQTKLTKKKVIDKLVKIWAKTRKLGMKLLKDVYETTKKELLKRLISGTIDDILQ